MTNEELATAIRGGERDRLPELWAQVERFVSMQAGRASRTAGGRIDAEDLYQSGFLGLVAAADSYEAGAGMSFVGWLALHLKTAFAEAGGYRTKRQIQDPIHSAASLDEPMLGAEGVTIGDTLPDPYSLQEFEDVEERIWRDQMRRDVEAALGQLPEGQQNVIRRRYFRGETFRQIAQEEGVYSETIRQQEHKALNILRRPRISAQLRQYIEQRTPYYSGVGLGAFQHGGSQPERLAVLREEWADRTFRTS